MGSHWTHWFRVRCQAIVNPPGPITGTIYLCRRWRWHRGACHHPNAPQWKQMFGPIKITGPDHGYPDPLQMQPSQDVERGPDRD